MSFTVRRTAGLAIAALAASTVFAACGSDEETKSDAPAAASADGCARPAESTEITIGSGSSLAYAHLYVAEELGYFDAENLDVKFTPIAKSSDTLPLISGGAIDAGFGGLSAGFFNAIDRGLDIRMVQARGDYPANAEKGAAFLVRSDLIADGTIKEVADLKGKTFGFAGGEGDIANAGGYFISQILSDGGLTLKDIKITNVGFGDTEAGFKSGAIDAAFVPSPFNTHLQETGIAEPFGDQEKLADETTGGLVLGPNLLKEDRVAGEALLRALMRAGEVMAEGDYRENPEVVDALIKHDFDERSIASTPLYFYEDGLPLNEESFNRFQEVFIDHGEVLANTEVVPFAELTDEDLREAAAASLETCQY